MTLYETTQRVNIRPVAGFSLQPVGEFKQGAKFEADVSVPRVNEIDWLKISGQPLYVAAAYARRVIPAPPPVIHTIGKIGWHVLPGVDTSALYGVLSRLYDAKRPVPFALAAAGGWVAAGIKKSSPATTVIQRLYSGKDYSRDWNTATRLDGQQYFQAHLGMIQYNERQVDAIQVWNVNEPGIGAGTNAWWHGMMDAANLAGIKIAVYCWSTGNPDLGFWQQADTHELLRRVKRESHFFTLHQYDLPGIPNEWTLFRHHKIYQLLPPDLQDLKLYITEFGREKLSEVGENEFAGLLTKYEDMLRNGPNEFAALWTLGDSGGWAADRWDDKLAVYERYMLSVRA